MAFCQNCGSQIPDGSATCPICGSVIYEHVNQSANNAGGYQQAQQTPYAQPAQPQQGGYQPYGAQPQSPYAQPAQQNPYAQQNSYGQPYGTPQGEGYNLAKSANTMGVLAIVFAFFSPLVCWILGGIGSGKANQAIQLANQFGDPTLLGQAEHSKKLCKIGIIIGIVLCVLSVIIVIAATAAGVATSSYY